MAYLRLLLIIALAYCEITTGAATTTFVTESTKFTDFCQCKPCGNNGTCVPDGRESNYRCDCKKAFNGSTCEERVYVANGSCKYHINFDDWVNQTDANRTCINLGGRLAMITDGSIHKFLQEAVRTLYGKDEIRLWIGGRKRDAQWRWDDFSEIGAKFKNWRSGMPSSRGEGLLLASTRSDSNLQWTYTEELNSSNGLLCEIGTSNICNNGTCQNGGECRNVGCHTYCRCMPGYGGKSCEKDLITIGYNAPSYTINPGEFADISVNINSSDGPIRLKVIKCGSSDILEDIRNVSGQRLVNIGPLWTTDSNISYRIQASPEIFVAYYERVKYVSLKVNLPQIPVDVSAKVCTSDATVYFTPHPTSIQLEHRIEVVGANRYRVIIPKASSPREIGFDNLPPSTPFFVRITVCPKCTKPSIKDTELFSTEPHQVIRYFVVTKRHDSDVCVLRWSIGTSEVSTFELTVKEYDITSGSLRKTQVLPISKNTSRYESTISSGKNYSFSLSAITCDRTAIAMDAVGECAKGIDAVVPAPQTATPIVLGIFFALSLLINIAFAVFFWRKRLFVNQMGDKDSEDSFDESVTPYDTSVVTNTKEKEGSNPIDYENVSYQNKSNPTKDGIPKNEYSQSPNRSKVKEIQQRQENAAEKSGDYEIPIIHHNKKKYAGYENAVTHDDRYENTKMPRAGYEMMGPGFHKDDSSNDNSIYQYENFEASNNDKSTEERIAMNPLTNKQKYEMSTSSRALKPTAKLPGIENVLAAANKKVALKPPNKPKPADLKTRKETASSQSDVVGMGNIKKQDLQSAALKPPITKKPGKAQLSGHVNNLVVKPSPKTHGVNVSGTGSNDNTNEMATALARLKPVRARK